MYTPNIIKLEKLLSKQLKDDKSRLEAKKILLEEKYETEWFRRHLSSEEAEEFDALKKEYHELTEVYEDFCNQNW